MNILLADHHTDWSVLGFFHEKYYSAQGHDVTVMPIEKTPQWTNWRNRLPFYVPKGMPIMVSSLEKRYQKKFDLVLEYDSSGQYHLGGLRHVSTVKAFWSCDIYRKDSQKFHAWKEEDFDVIFVAQKNFLPFFKKRKTYWLPYACDPALHRKFDLPKIYDVVFIGNMNSQVYPDRVQLLNELSKKFRVKVFSGFYGEEVAKVYSQSKIIFNKSHSDEVNMRVFDVLSCGSLLLTDRIENGLPDIFEDRKHLVMYDGLEDLKEKVDYYLSHDDEREKIACAGQKEVHEKHTFYHRAQTVLSVLGFN